MANNIIFIVILFIVILLAVAGGAWVVYQKQADQHGEELAGEQAMSEEWERKLEDATNQNADLKDMAERIAKQETEGRLQAEEARNMAELRAQKAEEERRIRIAELKDRLMQETEERRKAEKAMLEVAEKVKALEAAQRESQNQLLALSEARAQSEEDPEVLAELERVKQELKAKEDNLAMLARQQADLQSRYQAALDRQSQTAGAIIKEGRTAGERRDLLELITDLLQAIGLLPEKD